MLVGAFAGVAVVLDREESGRHVVRGAADRHGRRRAEELPEGAEPIHSLRTSMLVVIFGAPPLQSGNGRSNMYQIDSVTERSLPEKRPAAHKR